MMQRINDNHRTVSMLLFVATVLAAVGIRPLYDDFQNHSSIVVVSTGLLIYTQWRLSKLDGGEVAVEQVMNHLSKTADRLLLGCAIIAMLVLQIFVASQVLSDEDAAELTSLFDFGYVTVGAFELVGYLVILWMLLPVLSLIADVWKEYVQEVKA